MSANKQRLNESLINYDPPEWVSKLDNLPKHHVQLVHPDTPIHRWYVPGVPEDFELYIKRDDMTGSQLSGNKVRKLEFLLADAISKGCSTIITCGGIQSNHSRATTISGHQLGLKTHLLLKSTELDPEKATCKGNVLLDRLVGTHIHLIPGDAVYNEDIHQRMENFKKKISEEKGEKAYSIPCGGTNSIGLFGYVQTFQELLKQKVPDNFTDIAVAVGSGGTIGGLSMSNYLSNSHLRIHGMLVGDTGEYFHSEINKALDGLNWSQKHPGVQSQDMCEMYEEAQGRGYALSSPDELEFISAVAEATGILLDPVYTGKAAFHLIKMMKEKPECFKGKKVLFIHTGGMFALFDGRMDDMVRMKGSLTNRIDAWIDVDKVPEIN
ncbi:bifunctional D-cysteine desulfhydrase/1-aminocyclopropane-1-carboxylate deaminase, mitochondrial-like isoform X1 [Asterias rubens]|uniref:bifunctional D-cysteine desulfhydrase/1-aminocyclopropane-1-carboxylate deaminase, mitochondrial-like isoform X1 n=1 Tax=Asterias rubens TaxID=7604 RepID=UPI001454E8B8|nr:bifunctional D-cysteine desulfhydrase/1-aminocyclopropane-1-carboxylate deaminase, mitochondrial-like isoform X1 [Asterias rubens]